jgi:hypothetical protein
MTARWGAQGACCASPFLLSLGKQKQ